MDRGRGSASVHLTHAGLLALGAVLVFLLAHVSRTVIDVLQPLFPIRLLPLLERPYLIESVGLFWFVFSSYWFFALIDEYGWWKHAGLGLILGYTWVLWALSLFASPFLVARHLVLRQAKAEAAGNPVPAVRRATPRNPAHAAFERAMNSTSAIRPLVLEGRALLADLFAEMHVSLMDFVAYLEMELRYTPEQINRMFFQWYGICHGHSYAMAKEGKDPSSAEAVEAFLRGKGTDERRIQEVLAMLPRVRARAAVWDEPTIVDGPLYEGSENDDDRLGWHPPESFEDDRRRSIVDSTPTIDPDAWTQSP